MISKALNWFRLSDAIRSADKRRNELEPEAVQALACADLAHRVRHRLVLVEPRARAAIERALLEQGLRSRDPALGLESLSVEELREELRTRVASSEAVLRKPATLRVQRALRLAVPSIVILCGLIWASTVLLSGRSSLLEGATWKASSAWSGYSTEGTIPAQPKSNMFFSTNRETEPWLIIELPEPKTAAELYVENRADCCNERPVPLLVEASLDGKSYQEIAREAHPFKTWNPSFEPVKLRYLRFRSLKKTLLHFRHVALYAR